VLPLDLGEAEQNVEGVLQLLLQLGVETVRLLHVASTTGASKRAASRLEELAHRLAPEGMTLSSQVLTGSAVMEILQGATAFEAGVIAIPWKRKSWLQRSLVGSVTRDILRMNDVLTLVYRPRGANGTGPLRLVYASDLGPSDESVIPILTAGALQVQSVRVVHADQRAPDPEAENVRRQSVEGRLQSIVDEISRAYGGAQALDIDWEERVGKPRREVLRYVTRVKPDLVVLAKSGKPRGFAAFLGSVAEETAYRAHASVLVIPPEG
jgi:nucleotide-binding universal stress UspA family protein